MKTLSRKNTFDFANHIKIYLISICLPESRALEGQRRVEIYSTNELQEKRKDVSQGLFWAALASAEERKCFKIYR